MIVNASSGLVLDDPGGFATSNGGPIYSVDQLNGGLNQQWQINALGNGNIGLIVNASSGLVLDDPAFSTR